MAVLAYLGPLVIVPLLKPDKDRYLGYHTRQGTYIFILYVVAFLATLGLLYVFRNLWTVEAVFNVLAVVFLMELVVYVVGTIWLAVQASRGRMPMVPVIGELSGEA
jgi:uncharacterized membrane protein